MMRALSGFILLGFSWSSACAQSVGISGTPREQSTLLTLAQAEAIALKNNPQITISKLNALMAQQYVREARAALLPTANLNITAADSNPGSRLSAGALNNPILYPRAAAGAVVGQLITDFGRSKNLLSSSQYRAKAADENAAATTADIILTVDQAYYNVLETKAVVGVAEETISSRQTLVDKIKALTDAKLKSDLDLSFADVDLARGKLLLLEARNNYDTSLAVLSAILGYPDQQVFALVEESPSIAPPPLDVAPLIQQAIQQRPEVTELQNEIEAAQKFGSAEHDLLRPSASALGVVGEAPIRDNHIPNWYGAVGVNINIPIFNGFLYNARAKVADLQTEASRQRLMDLRNNIARDVRNRWQELNRSFERLSVTEQLRKQANLAFELAQARYNLGLGSIVEFSQAQLQKTEAEIMDTESRYQYRLSEIQLSYSTATPR
jgi:outer membrane protein